MIIPNTGQASRNASRTRSTIGHHCGASSTFAFGPTQNRLLSPHGSHATKSTPSTSNSQNCSSSCAAHRMNGVGRLVTRHPDTRLMRQQSPPRVSRKLLTSNANTRPSLSFRSYVFISICQQATSGAYSHSIVPGGLLVMS